mgnify:CR=1 FL=1
MPLNILAQQKLGATPVIALATAMVLGVGEFDYSYQYQALIVFTYLPTLDGNFCSFDGIWDLRIE